jgi:hypothetical protein
MSSSDYFRNLTSAANQKNGQESPIRQDPLIKVGPKTTDYVELALNTNQVARTFQDRSYIFYVKKREQATIGKTLLNLNVRGKRGNIVQCYPSVEYDLIPNNIELTATEAANTILQFQWTGSDYNPRRGCNDGEGGPYVNGDRNVGAAISANGNTQGSNQNSRMDRMTLLPVVDNRKNYPQVYSTTGANAGKRLGAPGSAAPWFSDATIAEKFGTAGCSEQLTFSTPAGNGVYPRLLANTLQPLTGDQIDNINNENQRENNPRNCGEGNALSPYFSPENVSPRGDAGDSNCLYSPRNNNFSNRETRICVSIKGERAAAGIPVPAQFIQITKDPEYADAESTNYTLSLETDPPPFEPVENDDYGDGQKEGCTQEMLLFTGSAASYAPFYFLFLALIQLF